MLKLSGKVREMSGNSVGLFEWEPWVRALKVYLAKTEDKCKNKELLFISYKDGHKGDLHKHTLSGGSGS